MVSAKSSIALFTTSGLVISMPATIRLSRGDLEPPHLRKSIYFPIYASPSVSMRLTIADAAEMQVAYL